MARADLARAAAAWRSRAAVFFQLAKLRIVELWLGFFVAVSLLGPAAVATRRAASILGLALISSIAVIALTCSLDDISGARDGVDQANRSSGARWGVSKPILDGRLSERRALGFVYLLAILTALGYLGVVVLAWPIRAWLLAAMAGVVLLAASYSYGPKLSYRGAGELVIFTATAATVLVPYALVARTVSRAALVDAALVGFWHVQVMIFSNTKDAEGDRSAGRKTIAARTSSRGNRIYIASLFALSWGMAAAAIAAGWVPVWYALALAPVWALQVYQLRAGVGQGQWLWARLVGFRVVRLGVAALLIVNSIVLHRPHLPEPHAMNPRTALSLARGGKLRLLWKLTRRFDAFYRVSFAAAAASSGLLALLAGGPRSFDRLAAELAREPLTRDALSAWLGLGVELGELDEGPDGYRLKGYLSRALAAAENDEVAALVEEVACLHHRLIVETPGRLRRGRLWSIDEHDGPVIARSSRILEPFVFEAQDRIVPVSGPVRLLDAGCGAGTCMRRAAERNPDLTAVGVERDPAVAAATRQAARRWGLQHRISVETGDIREQRGSADFDVVTLHNAIYYFPLAERVPLLEKLSSLLKPGGRLLVTTSCQGGSPGMRVLDLWTSGTAGFGPLPLPGELAAQMRDAGLVDIDVRRAIPGEQYFALTARTRRAAEPDS